MTIERAKRLAEQWASGGVSSLREGEAEEYHKMVLEMLLEKQEHNETLNGTNPVTNGDRIRAMSDEELARFLAEVEYRRAIDGGGALWRGAENTLEWLQQPAEGGENNA